MLSGKFVGTCTYKCVCVLCCLTSLTLIRWAAVVLLSAASSDGAKILFFTPFPAKSHHSVYRPIVRGLAEKGHEVHYYTPFPITDGPSTLKNVGISIARSEAGDPKLTTNNEKQPDQNNGMHIKTMSMTQIFMLAHSVTEASLRHQAVQNLLKSTEHFDLVITAACFSQESAATLAHRFNAPMAQIMPVGDYSHLLEMTGSPENPAYMMNMFTPLSDRMTFSERLTNTFYWFWIRGVASYLALTRHQNTADKYVTYPGSETRPSIMELVSDTALVLVNSHPSVGYSFPKASHVKEIGGINVVPNKTLPSDLKSFLDSATDGAIYFSLGSVVQVSDVAGNDLRKSFVNVFGKMKQKVLWKWEAEDFPDKPPNVMTSKWFPQQDVLAHENVKVFITQGGLMSLFESVSRGVPLLGIPFFGDQRKNLKHGITRGYAVQVDYDNLTEHSIQWALDELLYNPSYKLEAERMARLFHDRPMTPLEEAIYWLEYVLRHGNALRPQSAKMPFYQLYLLDVLGFCLVILGITVKILVSSARWWKSIICSKKSKTNIKID